MHGQSDILSGDSESHLIRCWGARAEVNIDLSWPGNYMSVGDRSISSRPKLTQTGLAFCGEGPVKDATRRNLRASNGAKLSTFLSLTMN